MNIAGFMNWLEVSAAVLEYENHLPATQLGTQVRHWNMDMTKSTIDICEQLEKQGRSYSRGVLAMAYNTYAYHCVDVKKDILFKNNNEEEAVRERKKIMLSKFYSGKGETAGRGKSIFQPLPCEPPA